MSSIVTSARDAILTIDASGRIVSWNRSARELFEYDCNGDGRPSFGSLLAPGSKADALVERTDDPSDEQKPELVEIEAITSSGRAFPAEMSLSSWRTENGEYRTAILRDSTERHRVEAALQEAVRSAKKAARIKSDFLANMSHEIRTPLNGVVGMAELLQETKLDPDQSRFVETIVSSGDVLLALINDILDLSKIEAGMIELELANFDIRSLIGEITDLLGVRIGSRDLMLSHDLDPAICEFVQGDSIRLRQILTNLAGNAIKFTERGEVAIRGVLVSETADSVEVRFEVRDTGIGIALEDQHRLFDAFTQQDTSTTRRFGGTGLGLSISKNLVKLMGGEIGVESVLGEGATFWFTVLLGKVRPGTQTVDGSDSTVAEPSVAADSATERKCSNARVLLVEDNAVNCLVGVNMLKKLGVDVETAENGREAVDKIAGQERDFALILMDWQMPEMNGLEATRKIRASEAGDRNIPIIALTANALRGDREECFEAGMSDYLTKPLKMSALRDVLERWT